LRLSAHAGAEAEEYMGKRRLHKLTAVAGAATLTLGLFGVGASAQATVRGHATSQIGHLDGVQARSLARDATNSVIVVFRNQVKALPETRTLAPARTAAVASIQAPVLRELGQLHAADVKRISIIDAVTAKVSAAEEKRLAADPAVSEVIPNSTFKLNFGTGTGSKVAHTTTSRVASKTEAACQPGSDGVELDPEALSAIHANGDLPGTGPTAASLGITGAGVTVAYMAEGIDPDDPDFIRPDGQHVFIDQKDFTGEGTTATTSGGEASLDASSIGSQGRLVFGIPLPTGGTCKFKILGAAPGASLVGLKVFPTDYDATTSAILEGIDYAVGTDHVNVLNQSFGYNPLPDTTTDVIRMADEAAVAAGTVVDVSSGDAGPTNTVGSPSTDPAVISAGATTTYRTYAQDDIANYDGLGATGWEDDNLSGLSSGGSTEGLKGPNVVAPGDLNWVDCQAPGFGACVSGGTSEAAPLTSATAALVIQAYRKTHKGATPTPALVKEIITSTASDLGLPANQQGSGIVNSYQAVLAAESIKTPAAAPAHKGNTLTTSTDDITATAAAGTAVTQPVAVTNDGTATQTVSLHGRILSTPKVVASGSSTEKTNNWVQVEHFTVAPGTSHLAASVSTVNPAGAFVDVTLIDPLGRLAVDGIPQGYGSTSNVGVRYPAAGRWTAYLTNEGPKGSAARPVGYSVTSQVWNDFGTVTPASITLAPNATKTVSVTMDTPTTPGDASAAVELDTPFGPTTSIPVALRSLVPITDGTGVFSAAVPGGNGRAGAPASTQYFSFDVPAGQPELNAATQYSNGPDNSYSTYLVAPSGETLGHASNLLVTGGSPLAPVTKVEPGTDSHVLDPAAGQWTLVVAFTNPASGPYVKGILAGDITFAPVAATVSGLPTSTQTPVATGAGQKVEVTVTNDANSPQSFFLDARLDNEVQRTLPALAPTKKVALPLAGAIPQWVVPTDTTALTGQADATAPVTFDMSPYLGNFGGELNGDPQVGAVSHGDTATATWADDPITPGVWNIDPGLVGVFGAKGSPAESTSLGLTATTAGFNSGFTTSYGDLWEGNDALTPVTVQPGQTVTLTATLSPKKAGSVTGVLYLDTVSSLDPFGDNVVAGDQVAAFPYSYTAKS
jgi:hypothetical protein